MHMLLILHLTPGKRAEWSLQLISTCVTCLRNPNHILSVYIVLYHMSGVTAFIVLASAQFSVYIRLQEPFSGLPDSLV